MDSYFDKAPQLTCAIILCKIKMMSKIGPNVDYTPGGVSNFWSTLPATARARYTGPTIELPEGSRPLVAGVGGGLVSTLLLHPLDLIKTRRAAGRSRGSWESTANIWRGEGARGFYRGMSASLALSGASWGLYFLSYVALYFPRFLFEQY